MIRKTKEHEKPVPDVVPNTFHVPARHWDTWHHDAKAMFNTVFGQVASNQSVMGPQTVQQLPAKAWHVICWNIMWMATDEANKYLGEV